MTKPLVSRVVVANKLAGSGYASEEEFIEARLAFREAARAQRCCQNPDCPKRNAPWDPHHVVYEQELRRRGLPIYDPRNVMRLCRRCHQSHHRTRPIALAVLNAMHFAYAREALGDFHTDYLNRRYAV